MFHMKHGNVIRRRRNVCLGCGMPFWSLRARNEFCSAECYALMYVNAGVEGYNHRRYLGFKISKDNRSPFSALVAGFKMNFGCSDCGYIQHPAALQFDHVSGTKEKDISRIRKMTALLREIGKCEVVCANCHSIRTYERLQKAKRDRESQ